MYTVEQLHALQQAIAEGARVVQWSGASGSKRMEFHSLTEMVQLEGKIKRELGLDAPKSEIAYYSHDRGTGR